MNLVCGFNDIRGYYYLLYQIRERERDRERLLKIIYHIINIITKGVQLIRGYLRVYFKKRTDKAEAGEYYEID